MPLESVLELDDIQGGVLRPRPTPYQATYVIFRIDDREAGRELMRRLSNVVASSPSNKSGRGHLGECCSQLPRSQSIGGVTHIAREFSLGVSTRNGRAGEGARRHWRKQS